MAFFAYEDRPGVIGVVGRMLGEADVNIAGMQVARDDKRGKALVALTVDSAIPVRRHHRDRGRSAPRRCVSSTSSDRVVATTAGHDGVVADLDADYFFHLVRRHGQVPDKDVLWTRLLELPPHVLSTSLLTGAALDKVWALFDLGADDVLLDLTYEQAAGGSRASRAAVSRLVGVDYAPTAAIDQATDQRGTAARSGLITRTCARR